MRSGRHWPFLIVGLLVASASANVFLLVRAGADPSFSVEPDYYAKAVAWDAHLEQLRKNVELGWRADVDVEDEAVVVRLTDRDGHPVAGARIALEAFHRARGNAVVRGTLRETPSHAYRAELPLTRPGIWEIRLAALRGSDTFTSVLERDVVRP